MKDKYIYLIVIGVILLFLLCSVSIDTKFSFTYMGNTGLWHLTLQLIFILFSKILMGGLSTFSMLLVLQLLIILTLVACKSKYIDSLIEKKKIKIPSKYVIVGAIIGAIVNFVFIQTQLRYHNKSNLKSYMLASEVSLLSQTIKDMAQNETYNINCNKYSYMITPVYITTSTHSTRT